MMPIKILPFVRGYYAYVDDDDYPELAKFIWHLVERKLPNGREVRYAGRWERADGKKKRILMHIQLLGAKAGFVTDHADGNGLNNQRNNLRFATKSQNAQNSRKRLNNSSGYKGVAFVPPPKPTWSPRWRAFITHNYKRIDLGSYKTREEAANAYAVAAQKLFGEFARVPSESC